MAVGGSAKRDENGGAAGGGNFGGSNGAGAANDDVRPGKALGHVGHERDDFGEDFAAGISGAHRVVVAFAGLVNDAQFFFARGETVHGIHESAINWKSRSEE